MLYKTYFDSGICTVKDLLLNLNNTESFEVIRQQIQKANFHR